MLSDYEQSFIYGLRTKIALLKSVILILNHKYCTKAPNFFSLFLSKALGNLKWKNLNYNSTKKASNYFEA